MNGLDMSHKISSLSNEISALNVIIMHLNGKHDLSRELRVLKEIKSKAENEKSILEDKLRSVDF